MMKRIIICIIILTVTKNAGAQSPFSSFDHIAFYVRDVDTSASFYTNLFLLDTIPHPFLGSRSKWLKLSATTQLHLIEGMGDKVTVALYHHLCLSVRSMEAVMQKLTELSVEYFDARGRPHSINVRPDGIKQIFFQDPDGYWIEVNNVVH